MNSSSSLLVILATIFLGENMNITLYELASEYQQLAERLSDTDMDAQTIADTIEGAAGILEEKAKNVAMFVRNLEASAAQIKEAEKAMKERREAIQNRADSVRQYLLDNMLRAGITKIECQFFAMTIKANPESVEIFDTDLVPGEFMRQPAPPPPMADKAAIKVAIKEGREIDGARLVKNSRLEIK